MEGKVKFFNNMKEFGFITGEDGKDYYVHKSALTPGTVINENDEVSFEAVAGDRGPKAVKVSLKAAGATSTKEDPVEEEKAGSAK